MTTEIEEVSAHPEMPVVNVDMDELMSQLNFGDDEIIEPAPVTVDGELVLESAVAQIEADEVAREAPAPVVAPVVAPAPAPEKKGRKKKAEDDDAAPKKAKTPRKFYASKVDRISDKLGADLGDYTILTVQDAALTGDALKAKQQETLDTVAGSGVKVQNRQTNLLEFCSGRSARLNEVIERAVRLVAKEGSIRTGDKGNLHLNLLAKPYSPAAARAMGNNTVAALRSLMVITKATDGSYVVNPDSLIWAKLEDLLGL